MTPADPPVSTGTSGTESEDALKEQVRRIAGPIFKAQFPQEARSDIRDISRQSFRVAWRPNNYRRRGSFTRPSDIPPHKLGGVYHHFKITLKGLVMLRDYPGVLLIVGPNVLQGVYSQRVINGVKETFLFERSSMPELEAALIAKRESIRRLIDSAMSDFCAKMGVGISPLVWSRYEDWVKGEEVIDSLPRELVIHDTFFKKVYGDGIEFKQTGRGESPVVHMKQYFKNRALEDVAPGIERQLAALTAAVGGRQASAAAAVGGRRPSAAALFGRVLRFPGDLLALDGEVRLLSGPERLELSAWTFERFGGVE